MSIEVMKLALNALERSAGTCFHQYAHNEVMSRPEHFVNQAITSLRRAIAEAEKAQPVAEHKLNNVRCACCGYMTYHREHMGCIRAAAPTQRQWVGLTMEEVVETWDAIIKRAPGDVRLKEFAQAIEAKLKDKNK